MQADTKQEQSIKTLAGNFFRELQATICTGLEVVDARAKFSSETWFHPHGGGGDTRIIQNGNIFEKGGVNYSNVQGGLSERLAQQLNVPPQHFDAAGISLVLHPSNPMVPTVHFNLRYLELEDKQSWFGGGMDLTPCYLFREDVLHFHSTLKKVCDEYDHAFYPRFKRRCDQYFYIKHRGETRGVGGIFFDYLKEDLASTFSFVQEVGNCFLPAYLPIVEKRKGAPWGEREKQWQLHRRGRYVEFNLVYDRGTLFGLETEGRIESILMSLPPAAEWKYNLQPEVDSPEAKLVDVLRNTRDWIPLS